MSLSPVLFVVVFVLWRGACAKHQHKWADQPVQQGDGHFLLRQSDRGGFAVSFQCRYAGTTHTDAGRGHRPVQYFGLRQHNQL